MTELDQVPASTRRFVAFTLRHARLIWLVALLLAVPAVWRTASLYANLRSELEHLLPKSAPSVKAIEEMRPRLPGLQHLGVVVDAGSAANLPQAERFLDDLGAKVVAYPPELVRAVRLGNHAEREFLEKHAAIYLEHADLVTVRERIEARRDWEVAKAADQLLDEDEAPPALDFGDIERKYEAQVGGGERVPSGRFSSKELAHTLLVVDVAPFSTGQGKGAELLRRVKADVAALGGPERYAAEKEPPLSEMVTRVFSVTDVIPPEQEKKLEEAGKIRAALTPRIRALIPEDKRDLVERLLAQEVTSRVGPEDLPPRLLVGLRERDGSVAPEKNERLDSPSVCG